MRDIEALDRSSFVPLYYQLQELLKEQIESGGWKPGDRLPSEPQLARRYGVSRVVVRQALAILEDDGQIVRVQGRGTFVAEPKRDARAGGLARLLATPRPPDVRIEVLEAGTPPVEPSIRSALGAAPDERVLRLTTALTVRAVPLAITYSFFRAAEVPWLEDAVGTGSSLPPDLVLAEHGVELAGSSLSIETSQCGRFEADRFGIPYRSAVFLVLSTEHRRGDQGVVPFEVARVEYRGDVLQLRLEASGHGPGDIEAVWALTGEAAR
ncbi:MAG TPA: GntR family transcriptional regulator [Thermoleophilaceae bacterium]|nr:GntR family transcriptional regulator [Thermoleophilaceae bacterium]